MNPEDLKKLHKKSMENRDAWENGALKDKLDLVMHDLTELSLPLNMRFNSLRMIDKQIGRDGLGKDIICGCLTALLIQSTDNIDEALNYLTLMREKIINADKTINKD